MIEKDLDYPIIVEYHKGGKSFQLGYYLVSEAIRAIRHYKKNGYRVEWICSDPDDNIAIWEMC